MSNQQDARIGLDTVMAWWRQAIIWTNDGLFHWCIYTPLGLPRVNTFGPKQNERYYHDYADAIFKHIPLNGNLCILIQIWQHLGNLLTDGTKSLTEPLLTFRHSVPSAFTWRQIYKKLSKISISKIQLKIIYVNRSYLSQGPMCLLRAAQHHMLPLANRHNSL